VALEFQHGVTGQAVDERGHPMPGVVVALYRRKDFVASAVADDNGRFLAGVTAAGDYDVAVQTEGGEPLTRTPVSVQSLANVGKVVFRLRGTAGGGSAYGGNGGNGSLPREAFTDLATYPVLTEEITTGRVPAPSDGGGGLGYGQTVDQALRDVLGWRPSTDTTGFQAALAGAFPLRQVEGHTEWTWQQRGYAVQADMGALTGAQASIYARATSALDQIQPLLAGLIPIDPALYPPQDLEAIRTVVSSELTELVSELGIEGGPRIQRVNELFRLLLGEDGGRADMNPDRAQVSSAFCGPASASPRTWSTPSMRNISSPTSG
jgi:Carboxypeptidase regulatory-like domain